MSRISDNDPNELPPLDPDLSGWDAVVTAIRKLTRSANDESDKEAA